MFARRLQVRYRAGAQPVPLAWLDNFAMRNFTNDACFDDLLPTADGEMEAGFRVPLPELEAAMTNSCRRKGRLLAGDAITIVEMTPNPFAS